jgi:hypothetical protein
MPARPCELVHTSQKHSNDIVYHNPRVAFTGDQKIPPSSAGTVRKFSASIALKPRKRRGDHDIRGRSSVFAMCTPVHKV